MPQLEILTFLPQIFWLILIFFACYIINVTLLIPGVRNCIESRNKKIDKYNTEIKQLDDMQEELSSQIESMYQHEKFLVHKTIVDAQRKADETMKEKAREINKSLRRQIAKITPDTDNLKAKDIEVAISTVEKQIWDEITL